MLEFKFILGCKSVLSTKWIKTYFTTILAFVVFTSLFGQSPSPEYEDPYNYSIFSDYIEGNRYTWDDDMLSMQDNDNGMWFRLMVPANIDVNREEKYPLVVFLHGSGEKGDDNALQLVHGGSRHITAVKSGEFPGLALYTQMPNDGTSDSWFVNALNQGSIDKTVAIIRKLIQYYNVDPDRVYIHGLSLGGNGSWKALRKYPELFAAAIPMSAAADAEVPTDGGIYVHIPIWLSQGGRDSNPTPQAGNNLVTNFRAIGGSIRYEFMPTTGHGTWTNMYNMPDFFSWMLLHRKTDIHVYFEQSRFCVDETIPSNLTLGVSTGFSNYEWARDNTSNIIASGATTNEITATTSGTYYVRVQRDGVWSAWSQPKPVDFGRTLSPAPVITSGGRSITLPGLDGSQSVVLSRVSGADTDLKWYKDGSFITAATDPSYTAILQGGYHLTGRSPATSPYQYVDYTDDGIPDQVPAEYRAEPIGCESDPSNVITVTTSSGTSAPLPPQNLFTFTRAVNQVELVWDDKSTNETGFEIYRSTDGGDNFTILALLPESASTGPVQYMDNQAFPDQEFCYTVRAYNTDGGSPYTSLSCTSTSVDNTSPVPPTLALTTSTKTFINIEWSGASDDVGVVEYDLYRNGSLILTTDETQYSDIYVVPLTAYTYKVVAKDAAGNASQPSNQLTAYSVNPGLFYKYYEISIDPSTVDQLGTSGTTLIRTGIVDNFDITVRDSDRDDRFGFIFQGYINIPSSGTYQFRASSDDGSRVYVNNIVANNNDRDRSCGTSWPYTSISLTEGEYPIEVRYYEDMGSECLTVQWRKTSGGGTFYWTAIPDNVLKDTFSPPSGPTAPDNLTVASVAYNQVNLTWQDNSNNETGFEIYRDGPADNSFVFLGYVGANVVSFSDQSVQPSSSYLYKVQAINNNGASAMTSEVTANTPEAPAAPFAPGNLMATAVSTSRIDLSWTDGSTNEEGFEIYRSTVDVESTYLLINTTGANVSSFSDTGLTGNNTFYYKVRAKGIVNSSAFTAVASATTLNNAPTIDNILSRSVQIGTTLEFEISAEDLDGDEVTFSKDGTWPTLGSITPTGFNKALLTFANPTQADEWDLRVAASDGVTTVYSNTFTITANNNQVPQISVIEDEQMNEAENLIVNVTASDDGGDVFLSTENLPAFAIFTDSGGGSASITFSPAIKDAGYYNNIQVIANDGEGGISIESFDLIVNPIRTNYEVFVNFTSNRSYSEPWNNAGGTTNDVLSTSMWPVTDLKTTDNNDVEVTLDISGAPTFTAYYSISEVPGVTGGGVVPDEVIRHGLVQRGTTFNVLINNLSDALQYNLSFLSSIRDGLLPSNDFTTYYEIGGLEKSVDPRGNDSQFVEFNGITPVNGTISIQIRPTINGSSGTRTILNALKLEAYYDDGTAPAAPSGLVTTAISHNKVSLSWADNSYNETGFKVFRRVDGAAEFSEVIALGQGITSVIDSTGLSGTSLYYYYVQAYNNNGSSNSETRSVVTSNAPPVVEPVSPFIIQTGALHTVNVSAYDPEGYDVDLQILELPDFASFVDNGDGTGVLTLDPEEEDADKEFSFALIAKDNANTISEIEIKFYVNNSGFDQVVKLNFTTTGQTEAQYWNNFTTISASPYTGIEDVLGNTTSITLNVSGWQNAWERGATYTPNTLYPTSVIRGGWYSEQSTGTLTFNNLDPTKKYNISLLSSIDDTWEFDVQYAAQGQTTQILDALDAFKNYNKIKGFAGLMPDATGNITVDINNQGDSLVMVNAVVLERYTSETKPFMPKNLVADVLSSTEVQLNWTDNSGVETGYEIYRYDYSTSAYALVTTTSANVQEYKVTGLEANKKYGFKVRAIADIGNSDFSPTVDATTLDYTIYVNVGNAGSTDVSPNPFNGITWNNTHEDPATGNVWLGLYKSTGGTATTVGLGLNYWATGGSTNNGMLVVDGLYPLVVLESSYFLEANDEHVLWEWNGLDNGNKYNLFFSGSRRSGTGVAVNGESEYIVGQDAVKLNSWINSKRNIGIYGVSPDGSGRIEFETKAVDTPVRTGLANNYGFIGALELQVYSDYTNTYPTESDTYYAIASDATVLSSWNDYIDGTGASLTSFANPGITYQVPESVQLNISTDFNLNHEGSRMKFANGSVLNFNADDLTLEVTCIELEEGAQVQFTGPGLTTATIIIGDEGLNLRDGSTLDIGNATLQVTGKGIVSINNSDGQLATNGGSIELTNSTSNTHHLYFAENSIVESLTINNTAIPDVVLHDSLSVSTSVEIANGHLVTNGYLKLISDANGTAMIAPIGSTSAISGDVEYQRYWSRPVGTYGFFYLGSPIEAQTIQEWIGEFHIQGINTSSWRNLNKWDETSSSWIGIGSADEAIVPGKGINAFMFSSNFSDQFIRYNNIGPVTQGVFNFDLTYTEEVSPGIPNEDPGWNLVSNPYPCAIDWSAINWSGAPQSVINRVDAAFYVWSQENSGYITWTPASLEDPYIASGQGFFIHTNDNNANPIVLQVGEDIKTVQDIAFLREGTKDNILQIVATDSENHQDKAHISLFEDATYGFDSHLDALKLQGSYINLTSVGQDGNKLAVNALPLGDLEYIVPLNFEAPGPGNYSFLFNNVKSFGSEYTIYLSDEYTLKKLEVKEGTKYEFTINEEQGSKGESRFILMINHNVSSTLIKGGVKDVYGRLLKDVIIYAMPGDDSEMLKTQSSNEGLFELELSEATDYSFNAEKSENYDSWKVNFIDYIVLTWYLKSWGIHLNDFEYLAADLDRSGNIDKNDLKALRKLLRNRRFHDNTFDYYFITENFELEADVFKYKIDTGLKLDSQHSLDSLNLIGIVPGDIYQDNRRNNERQESSQESVVFAIGDHIERNGQYHIPIYSRNFQNITGFQVLIGDFSYEIKSEALSFENNDQSGEFVKDDLFWASETDVPTSLPDGTLLYTLVLDKKAGILDGLISELSTGDHLAVNNRLQTLALRFEDLADIEGMKNSYLGAYPNPFTDEVKLKMRLLQPEKVTFSLYNANGVLLHNIEKDLSPGLLQLDLESDLHWKGTLPKGLVIFNIQLNNTIITDKLIHK